MAAKKKARTRNIWTDAETKLLKLHAGKTSVADLVTKLKRSAAAIRFKAFTLKTSLASRKPAKKAAPAKKTAPAKSKPAKKK